MKLVVWNCRMALHAAKKWGALTALHPDLAVVPEAASPRQPAMSKVFGATRSHSWLGPNEKKGLAAMSFGDYVLDPLPRGGDDRADALATKVSGPRIEFILIAVWARAPKYVEHLHDVLDAWLPLMQTNEVVLAGDFNSNAAWDCRHGQKNHGRLVQRLDALGLVSAYHLTRSEAHGAESEKTLAWSGPGNRKYHVDYVFLPRSWCSRLTGCTIGEAGTWSRLSDHYPVAVEVVV